MSDVPLVSIVIPARNAGRTLSATLDSALAQTWSRIEIIVVDDGSDDDTAAIAMDRADDRIRLVRQAWSGQSAAQNEGFRQSRGEFIQRLDADDLIAPRKIELQMTRIQHTPRALAAGEWARFIHDPAEASFATPTGSADMTPIEWLTRDCANGLPMLQPCLWLASRELVAAAGPWDERLTLNNDFDYGVRLLLQSERVCLCPGARLFYRLGNPASLGSLKTPAAWRSSLLSMELGAEAMLAHSDAPQVRSACANMFQQLAFSTYLDAPDVCDAAERHVARLGGSTVAMDGGLLFQVMRRTIGWRQASRVKRTAYRVGYDRVAMAKSRGRFL